MALEIPGGVNIVTALLICAFALPVLAGVIWPLTGDRIQRSFFALFRNLILLASIVLSVYLTRILLADRDNVILTFLYGVIPGLRDAVLHQDVWVYAIAIVVLLIVTGGLLHLIMMPVYRYAVGPASERFSSAVRSMSGAARRALSGLWRLPASVWLVLALSLSLGFYIESPGGAWLGGYASGSAPYQQIQANVIQPLLNSSAVKNIQILLNDSFQKAKNAVSLTRYFNGMPLEDAVRSSSEIDAAARKIVGAEKRGRQKAYLIYNWITRNIDYDNGKALVIAQDPTRVSSGAAVAYRTRSGVCFDYACLYVAMCRAAGVRVRFVTGLGYTGTAWGDHAWNQAYDPDKGVWIDVDTTFGSSGADYFGKVNFNSDHSDGVVQGEWTS